MAIDLLDAVLALPSTSTATNFYLDSSDSEGNFRSTAAERRGRLQQHLSQQSQAEIVLVGEAAGWKGARQSGVAFTSAKAVGLEGVSTESSATIVHGRLSDLGFSDRVLLWNAFPLHPHKPGVPRSNRKPTTAEAHLGHDALRIALSGRRIICVGEVASASVGGLLGIPTPKVSGATPNTRAITVRHPANGGAPAFRAGLENAFSIWGLI